MKNKMILILGGIVILFVGLIIFNNINNDKKIAFEGTPYGDMKLHQKTIDQLDDPLYQNIILPEDLDKALENKDDMTVYFFSPTCMHCVSTTPIIVPLAEEMDIDMKKLNLLEFDVKNQYDIQGTPTIVHYKNGEEVAKLVGSSDESTFKTFFEENIN